MSDESETYHLYCIVCPEGCEMEVLRAGGDFVFAEGICRRGQEYARREIENPCRVLTTTVPVIGGEIAMLPVRTREPIPKGLLMKAMAVAATVRVEAPVSAGDTVCPSIAGSEVDLVACRPVGRQTRRVMPPGADCEARC